jgi:hypothetical protein
MLNRMLKLRKHASLGFLPAVLQFLEALEDLLDNDKDMCVLCVYVVCVCVCVCVRGEGRSSSASHAPVGLMPSSTI